jgi:hypothetical protein
MGLRGSNGVAGKVLRDVDEAMGVPCWTSRRAVEGCPRIVRVGRI